MYTHALHSYKVERLCRDCKLKTMGASEKISKLRLLLRGLNEAMDQIQFKRLGGEEEKLAGTEGVVKVAAVDE